MDTTRHAGRIAIVTGAASGIGKATAVRLAAEGAQVFAADINVDGLAATASDITSAGGVCIAVKCDVTQQQDINALVAQAGSRIDILANVAGIMDHFLPLGEVDDETWDEVFDVNLKGVMRLTRAVIPVMEAAGKGSIVTVVSKAAVGAGAAGVAYTSSKHAVAGLVKSVAYFYGAKGIRSNGVLPGAVNTNIGSTSTPKAPWAMERALLSMASMQPPAEPDQIATAVSWLASDEASNVNGSLLLDDNGWATA
jgi:NAD(P)-dependent dehydrogenase (short-subunit alcohol dehydrogenase family)